MADSTQDPIEVDVPDLGTVQFPAGTSQDVMRKAIDTELAKRHVGQGQSVPHPIVDRLLSWLPTVEGAGLGILGGAAGAVAGSPAIGSAIGSGLGAAMGESQRQSINKIVGNPTPENGENAIGMAALQGAGGSLLGSAAGPAIKAVSSRIAPALMQSAVKPSAALTAKALTRGVRGDDLPVVKTLLKEGVNVTEGGLTKLQGILSSTHDEIADAVSTLPGKVYPGAAVRHVGAVEAAAAKQVNPAADVQAVRDVKDEFLSTFQRSSNGQMKPPMSLAEAQAVKQGTYKSIAKSYGQMKAPAIEAQKAVARGLKEDIEREAMNSGVDIKALNIREGNAMEAADAVAKRLAVAGNRDVGGLAWIAHNPNTALGFVLMRSPAVKSMIANGAYASAAQAAKVPLSFIRAAVTALATAPDTEQQP